MSPSLINVDYIRAPETLSLNLKEFFTLFKKAHKMLHPTVW